MDVATRDLSQYTSQRMQINDIELVYEKKTLQADGSFSIVNEGVSDRGYVTDLDMTKIQRLRESGINIRSGAMVLMSGELEKIPDKVKHRKDKAGKYRETSRVVEFNINAGVTVLVLDTTTMRPEVY